MHNPGSSNEPPRVNIADRLTEVARLHPRRRSIIFPHGRDAMGRVAYTHLTFQQLEELCNRYAHGLRDIGIGAGVRTLLMVRPSLDFAALAFALFKVGAVPVMIDPGMGPKEFVRCVGQVRPQAMLGIPAAHVLRAALRPWFRSIRIPVVLGRSRLFCRLSTNALLRRGRGRGRFSTAATQADDTAAILFTSGSTGPAKGVVYTHRIFDTQVKILRDVYGIGSDDIDLPCFPLFSLFSTALGATAVIPDMDPTKPATVNPERIVEAIENHAITCSFGSPTLWRTVTAHCIRHKIKFPTLKKVLMAGAPIPRYIHDRLLNHILTDGGQTHTPYGATEALPVADFTGHEVLAETWEKTRRGAGVCVGHPIPGLQVNIIRTSDQEIAAWDDSLLAKPGEIGEITVKGSVVTPEYYQRPQPTKLAKIADPDGAVWHRMGDLGYLDQQGRLWVCGRKSHRVPTPNGDMQTLCCEAFFNEHPDVYRSALVGLPEAGSQWRTPAVVIEPESGKFPGSASARQKFQRELLELAAHSPLTKGIRIILFHRSFPVDVRHNAKIKREILADWAVKKQH